MAPLELMHQLAKRDDDGPRKATMSRPDLTLEAWAQGFNVGSLIILILIVFCNYRGGIWLHKLILLELVLALWHGTFIFFSDPSYGWYLSVTATLLFISYQIHNVVSWLKIRPFLPRWGSILFISSLMFVQPFWVVEAWSNFEYFNHLGSKANIRIRPWEALLRDPWWIFTTIWLIRAIQKSYQFTLKALVKLNRRFGVLLASMFLSIIFLVTDIAVSAARVTASSGINPFWRFALVFKCASDVIFLDDFKTVLDEIVAHRFGGMTGGSRHRAQMSQNRSVNNHSNLASQLRSGHHPNLDHFPGASGPADKGKIPPQDRETGFETLVSSGAPKRPSVVRWLDPFKHRHDRNKPKPATAQDDNQIQHTTEMSTRSEVWDETMGSPSGQQPRVAPPPPPPPPAVLASRTAQGTKTASPRASRMA
ncbi:unnamed protein product [Periconia digitata]|uniref:Uncharacterized protein n=1 Tax=Periconia digitata TaxID=1303443 RepID=A0A9W4U745_9PLEO|nr:unnamed protein product [Periconia digitata]